MLVECKHLEYWPHYIVIDGLGAIADMMNVDPWDNMVRRYVMDMQSVVEEETTGILFINHLTEGGRIYNEKSITSMFRGPSLKMVNDGNCVNVYTAYSNGKKINHLYDVNHNKSDFILTTKKEKLKKKKVHDRVQKYNSNSPSSVVNYYVTKFPKLNRSELLKKVQKVHPNLKYESLKTAVRRRLKRVKK